MNLATAGSYSSSGGNKYHYVSQYSSSSSLKTWSRDNRSTDMADGHCKRPLDEMAASNDNEEGGSSKRRRVVSHQSSFDSDIRQECIAALKERLANVQDKGILPNKPVGDCAKALEQLLCLATTTTTTTTSTSHEEHSSIQDSLDRRLSTLLVALLKRRMAHRSTNKRLEHLQHVLGPDYDSMQQVVDEIQNVKHNVAQSLSCCRGPTCTVRPRDGCRSRCNRDNNKQRLLQLRGKMPLAVRNLFFQTPLVDLWTQRHVHRSREEWQQLYHQAVQHLNEYRAWSAMSSLSTSATCAV